MSDYNLHTCNKVSPVFQTTGPCAACAADQQSADRLRAMFPVVNADAELHRLRAELAGAKEELSIVKRGDPNHPDRAYATKTWLETFGFRVFCALKHGKVGFVLSLLQEGDISRGKAAEAIAELLVGNEPILPKLQGNTFGEDDFPSETVANLRAELAAEREKYTECSTALDLAITERDQYAEDAEREREKRETAERQRDEMAAALKEAQNWFTPEQMRFGNPPSVHTADAILAARDARIAEEQRRKGAAEALRELAVEQQQWGVWVACTELLNRADAIDHGELMVGERYPPERKQDGASMCPVTE